MAAKKVSRATTKKLKDKWRAKQWYTIHAPELFDNKEIPSTPADDPSKIQGRVVEVTMQELTGDFSKSYIKLKFRVSRVAGFDAYTTFIGHEFTSDYIRRLTRRRRTKVDGVFDVTTKDGYRIRVKPMAIAEHRIQSSQKAAIRQQMSDVVMSLAKGQRMGEFIGAMIQGDVSRDIFRACKHIYRLKRIDIRRSQVLGQLSTHKAIEEDPEDIDAIPEEGTEIDAIPEGEEGEEQPSDLTEEGAGSDLTEESPEGDIPVSEEGAEESVPAEVPASEEIPEESAPIEEPASEEVTETIPEESAPIEEPASEEDTETIPEESAPIEEPASEEATETIPEESAPTEEPDAEEVTETIPEESIPVNEPVSEDVTETVSEESTPERKAEPDAEPEGETEGEPEKTGEEE